MRWAQCVHGVERSIGCRVEPKIWTGDLVLVDMIDPSARRKALHEADRKVAARMVVDSAGGACAGGLAVLAAFVLGPNFEHLVRGQPEPTLAVAVLVCGAACLGAMMGFVASVLVDFCRVNAD